MTSVTNIGAGVEFDIVSEGVGGLGVGWEGKWDLTKLP